MAEGMLRIGLLPGEPEADNGDHRGGGVGQVVEGVRHYGDGACDEPGKELHREQQDVQSDAQRAAERAIAAANGGVCRVFTAGQEKFDKQSEQREASLFLFHLSAGDFSAMPMLHPGRCSADRRLRSGGFFAKVYARIRADIQRMVACASACLRMRQ